FRSHGGPAQAPVGSVNFSAYRIVMPRIDAGGFEGQREGNRHLAPGAVEGFFRQHFRRRIHQGNVQQLHMDTCILRQRLALTIDQRTADFSRLRGGGRLPGGGRGGGGGGLVFRLVATGQRQQAGQQRQYQYRTRSIHFPRTPCDQWNIDNAAAVPAAQ